MVKQYITTCLEHQSYKFNEELKCYDDNGSTRWFRCSGFVLTNPETASKILITTYIDITKYKIYDTDLRLKINRFNHVIEGAYFGSWEHNILTGEIIINNRWAEIIGYSLAELGTISKDAWKQHTHPEDYIDAEKYFQEPIEGKSEFYACQIRMKHRDGHWVWVFSRGKVANYTKDGEAEWISGSHNDITHIKQNEFELTIHKALIEKVNEIAKIGAWEFNFIINEVYWNSTIKNIFEVADDYVPTLENSTQFIYKEEDQKLRTKYIAHAIATGEQFDHTLQIKTNTGKLICIHSTRNLKYEDNKPVALYGFFLEC